MNLFHPKMKGLAMQLVSSAENSTLDWSKQYAYIEDIHDGRGYTAGIIGFCSGTGDMLDVVEKYTLDSPGNPLAVYLPALRKVTGNSHSGLGGLPSAWKKAAKDPVFQRAQEFVRDRDYFNPSVSMAVADGLDMLGQFIYYDAMVMHGPGMEAHVDCFNGIRRAAMLRARRPVDGGCQVAYLSAFLDARVVIMKKEDAHQETDRVDLAQRVWLRGGNLNLDTPLQWVMYEESFKIK
jgi:chitosanase